MDWVIYLTMPLILLKDVIKQFRVGKYFKNVTKTRNWIKSIVKSLLHRENAKFYLFIIIVPAWSSNIPKIFIQNRAWDWKDHLVTDVVSKGFLWRANQNFDLCIPLFLSTIRRRRRQYEILQEIWGVHESPRTEKEKATWCWFQEAQKDLEEV